MTRPTFQHQDEMLAFDLDSTLVSNKSGKKFPDDVDDFKYTELVDCIPDNSHIVIFTNQSYTNEEKLKTMLFRVLNIVKRFRQDVAIKYYIGYKLSGKPSIHLFNQYVRDFQLPKKVLYVGDAAGREDDFASSDYKFVLNIQSYYRNEITAEFMTPEQYMNKDNETIYASLPGPKLSDDDFIPKDYIKDLIPHLKNQQQYIREIAEMMINKKSIVLFVGPPYCGAERLSEQINAWAKNINEEIEFYNLFGTRNQIMKDMLETESSMFVTKSINKESDREAIINIADENDINPIIIYWDFAQLKAIKHYIDMLEQLNKETIKRYAYNNYEKHIEAPSNVNYYWKFDTFLYDSEEYKFFMLYN